MLTVPVRAEPDAVASSVEVWIDTGFIGELVMPRSQIDRMGLNSLLKIPIGLAPVARGALHYFGIQLELSSAKT